MKNKALLLIILFYLAFSATAQNVVYEIPVITKNSLIREYNNNIDIIYNHNGQSSFLYVDRVTGTVIEAVLPNPYIVTDMEIAKDNLFFCAKYGTNNYLCFFDINSLFFSSGQVTELPIPYYPSETHGGVTYTGDVTLTRLEVHYCSVVPGDLHVYIIGEVDFPAGSPAVNYSCIMDMAYEIATNSWDMTLRWEPGKVYSFKDLVVTDNYLWVVGHKQGGTCEYMHGYTLSPTGSPSTLCLPLGPVPTTCTTNITYWTGQVTSFYPVSRQRVEKLVGDIIAVACYGIIDYYNPQVVVSVYSVGIVPSLIKRIYVPNVTGTSEFRDLKYNPYSNHLFLLPEHTATTTYGSLYDFDLTSWTTQVFSSSLVPRLHSVDFEQGGAGAVVSAISNTNSLGLWKMFPNVDGCANAATLTTSDQTDFYVKHDNPLEIYTKKPSINTFAPSILVWNLDWRCGDLKDSINIDNGE